MLALVFWHVTTGRINGVAKQLSESFPQIVAVACAAHRLALVCKDASNEVKYLATFRNHLQELHLYFRHSANRSAALKTAATTLGLSDLRMKVLYSLSLYSDFAHQVNACDERRRFRSSEPLQMLQFGEFFF